jgi:orotate phosphoribosyltransferase
MDIVAPAMRNLEGSTRFNAQSVESGGTVQNMVEAVLNGLNISLIVDGQTFGKASIKAINTVQRNAGTVLLEM